jgi:hypothetical protein
VERPEPEARTAVAALVRAVEVEDFGVLALLVDERAEYRERLGVATGRLERACLLDGVARTAVQAEPCGLRPSTRTRPSETAA